MSLPKLESSTRFEPVLEKVFSTGKAVLGYEFSGAMPSRKEEACWRASYFPIFSGPSKVSEVAAIVLDMTILRRIERRFAQLLESVHSQPPIEKSHKLDMSPVIDQKPGSLGLPELTGREVQTFKLLVSGNSNKEVAATLGLSIRTVEGYRARIMLKLDVNQYRNWCISSYATK